MVGIAIKQHAGPSIGLSFLLSGLAALLSALCYAEFASHVERAGSIYLYTYSVLGEFAAFIIGWNTILIYFLCGAADARAFSKYIDSLFFNIISNHTMEAFGRIDVPGLAKYPDFLAFAIILIVVAILALGVRASVTFNNIFTVFSVSMLMLISVIGYISADGFTVWNDPVTGGYFPKGGAGTLEAAAMVFFIFVGFDCTTVAAEEATDPKKNIPMAILISVFSVILITIISSTSITFLVPYVDVDDTSPYASALIDSGVSWAQYLVAAGTITATSTTVLGVIMSFVRVIYAFSCDGLLFQTFSYIHPTTNVPLFALLVGGVFVAIIALIADIEILMFGISSAALLSYFVIAICIIYLRYTPNISRHILNYVRKTGSKSGQSLKSGRCEEETPLLIEENEEESSLISVNGGDKSSSSEHKKQPSETQDITGTLKERFKYLQLMYNMKAGRPKIVC